MATSKKSPLKKDDDDRKYVFSSQNVEEITNKMNDDGYVPKRYENPWLAGQVGVRKPDITFDITEEEIEEYIKCKLDVKYFAEKYCKIKREDGSVGSIKLRPYQKEILDLFANNRFSILASSRQSGKCFLFNMLINTSNYTCSIGELYYNILSKYRPLTFLEKIKIFLYKLLIKFS